MSLSASSSQPLAGRVPGRVAPVRARGPISVAGYRYSIRVTPSLTTGSAGWEVWTAYSGRPFGGVLGGGGGGGYPTAAAPIFQGSGVGPWNIPAGSGAAGDTVAFVVTGPEVAAVQIGARTIRTFASSQLPAGDRAAVFFVGARGPLPIVGRSPGQPISSHLRVLAPSIGRRPRWTSVAATVMLPLDATGRVLPSGLPSDPGSAPGRSFWQAPSAVTPTIHEPPYHGRTHPGPGVCELTAHGLPGLTPEWGSTISALPTAPGSVGELFVSCVSTEDYLHGWPMVAAILLDARHPGTALGSIPGAQSRPGHPGLVQSAGASRSARRVGDAWLVVQGGSGPAQRLSVLDALRVKRLRAVR